MHPVKRIVSRDGAATGPRPYIRHAGRLWTFGDSAEHRIEGESLHAVFVETSDPGRELAVYADVNAEAYIGSAWPMR